MTACILLAPTHYDPGEWWNLFVVPHLRQKAEAEARRDWSGALEALDRAIARAEERKGDFRDRLGGLRAERKELEGRLRAGEKAESAWRALDLRVRDAEREAEPWKKKFELLQEGKRVRNLCAGSSWEKSCKATLERIRGLPAPPPGWAKVKQEAAIELNRREYGGALFRVAEFERRADPGDLESVNQFKGLVHRLAWEEFKRCPEDDLGKLEAERDRFAGTPVEAEIRKWVEKMWVIED